MHWLFPEPVYARQNPKDFLSQFGLARAQAQNWRFSVQID
jgi:hypothetical protein